MSGILPFNTLIDCLKDVQPPRAIVKHKSSLVLWTLQKIWRHGAMEKAMSFFLFIHQFAPAQKFPQILWTGFNSIGTKDHVGGRFVYHF